MRSKTIEYEVVALERRNIASPVSATIRSTATFMGHRLDEHELTFTTTEPIKLGQEVRLTFEWGEDEG